jgi:lactoylglutathione lyase
MQLGAFSVSLAVSDIHASKAFYEQLGFEAIAGNVDERWLILKNGACKLGLFQGMFEKNVLTFNPGWDAEGAPLSSDFTDVRELQRELEAQGIAIEQPAAAGEGPAHITLVDPDGNPILIDQHV